MPARGELGRLARELGDVLALEAAVSELGAASLAEKVTRLRSAAGEQYQALEDERTLLGRDVAALTATIERALAEFAAKQPAEWAGHLTEVARNAKAGQLENELRQTVEMAVRESFEEFRQAEAEEAERSWRQLAERFRDRTQDRVERGAGRCG